jgi:hypothetical protein
MPPGGIIVKPPLPGPLNTVTVNGHAIQSFDAKSVVLEKVPAVVVMHCRVEN